MDKKYKTVSKAYKVNKMIKRVVNYPVAVKANPFKKSRVND